MTRCARTAALACLACCCACSDSTVGPIYEHPGGLPNDPPEFSLWDFDGYAGDKEARLYWDASLFSESGPVTAGLEEVKIWMSLTGPLEGFSMLRDGFRSGVDSTLVSDLTNGASYFFRVTAHDSLGGVVAASQPIWLEPGPQVVPVISIPAPQAKPIADLRYRRNLAWSPDGNFLAFIKMNRAGIPGGSKS